jgi:pyruvate-formate lyase-activating enzyme
VLENFRKVHDLGIPLSAESIYIPGLIDLDEIMKIARFISSIDPKIHYHIDAYIPVDDRWRAPTAKEIINAALEAEKYLKNVSYLCGDERLEHEVIQAV